MESLSKELLEKCETNPNQIDWFNISRYQKLSEEFIEKFQEKVYWNCISQYQKLSEKFIDKFQEKVYWYYISEYQKLSEKFIEKHNLSIPESSWMYKDKEWKRKYIQDNTEYEIVGNKVIAYKSCRSSGYSAFNFQYYYEVGNEYESHADYNSNNENSFGLSAWTKEKAIEYHNGKLFKVEIELEDIACIVHGGSKIRASKLRIVEEVYCMDESKM